MLFSDYLSSNIIICIFIFNLSERGRAEIQKKICSFFLAQMKTFRNSGTLEFTFVPLKLGLLVQIGNLRTKSIDNLCFFERMTGSFYSEG